MMKNNVGRIIGHVISLIIKGEIDEAIELIKKDNIQCYAGDIVKGVISHPEMNDNVVIRFVDQYIKNEDLLSYLKGENLCSVLLDFTKELGVAEPTPIFWRKSTETMQLYVCDLLKRDKETNVKILYSFRDSSELLLSELAKKELGVSSPEEYNDPFDCLILSSIRQIEQQENFNELMSHHDIKTFVDELQKIRVRCFVGEENTKTNTPTFLNTLMWAHYANSHKGICIKYSVNEDSPLLHDKDMGNLKKGRLDHVIYSDNLIENKGILNYGECFLTKSSVWEYEDEYRLVYYNAQKDAEHYTIPLNDLGLRIEAIYFGLNCNESYRLLIQKILKGRKIDLFHIERDTLYLNKLKVMNGMI